MEILIETYTADEAKIIVESVDKSKDLFFSGIFMEAENRNRNGRIYQTKEIARACDSFMETIKTHGILLSETDHPDDNGNSRRLQTLLSEVGGGIVDIKMKNNQAYGRMKILDTPKGKIVKEICAAGWRPGVSSRGSGNVDVSGLVEGFTAITCDIVVVPSCQNALPTPTYEGLEHLDFSKPVLTLAEAVRDDAKAQKYFIKEIHKFMEQMIKYKIGTKI